ncbi:MAG: GNAT family N-acetyltransferase [Hydrotalea flava]|uniref:GNAT family N-acetyltransferase n=1 Tax=Hydrotalea TaxID=1004300 RepID=UPI00094252FD|nr:MULTISPECIES: GNAT family N-acetyltransferase [Hydrotalea]NIM34598.1 GNAT family N-acetyltransferase [Hydrotalea flava]NIM37444.1 GNAT family N-acetyltransferase [Hydrotalea flava]NIN03192.1 GNAT family N-acetyltransferase [Hydrotalea flava]NIN14283.1 GNAT family N-acetyltransferase [Hydrotalea flava]NIO93370.1 GNAT family N-acetyltransferase [Hydrotalea flava]
MSTVIQKAKLSDIPVIQHIAYATWPIAYGTILSKAQIEYMLNLMYSKDVLMNQLHDGYTYLMAVEDEKLIGFAAYNAITAVQYKLQKLYILPTTQGSGIGKLLLQTVIDQVKSAGAQQLILNVNRQNKAIGFYTKMGFQILKEEDNDIGNGYFMNDYVMAIELN